MLKPLTLTCRYGTDDTISICPPDGLGEVSVSIAMHDPNNSLFWLDKATARELFNWLGVYLHT